MNHGIKLGMISGLLLLGIGANHSIHARSPKNDAVGKILKFNSGRAMVEAGDLVTVIFAKRRAASAGDKLTVFKIREDLINSGTEVDDDRQVEEILGVLEIIKMSSPRRGI